MLVDEFLRLRRAKSDNPDATDVRYVGGPVQQADGRTAGGFLGPLATVDEKTWLRLAAEHAEMSDDASSLGTSPDHQPMSAAEQRRLDAAQAQRSRELAVARASRPRRTISR